MTWLAIRHRVSVCPERARDLVALRKEAYMLGSLLLLYRRGLALGLPPGNRPAAGLAGRELCGSTVGILGLSPAAHTLAGTLSAQGVRLIGYDPAVHHTSPLWDKLRIKPVTLPELMSRSDAVSLQTLDATRFNSFFNDKVLAHCKPGQMWVGISRRSMFDEAALAAALTDGRIEACILDGDDADALDEASPLKGLKNLHLTPCLGSHTREAHLRSCWYVAHRLSVAISIQACAQDALPSAPLPLESGLAALLPGEVELQAAYR